MLFFHNFGKFSGVLIDWFGNHEILGWYNNEYDALLILLGVIVANYLNAYFGFWSQLKVRDFKTYFKLIPYIIFHVSSVGIPEKAFMIGYTVRTRLAGVMYRKLFRLRFTFYHINNKCMILFT